MYKPLEKKEALDLLCSVQWTQKTIQYMCMYASSLDEDYANNRSYSYSKTSSKYPHRRKPNTSAILNMAVPLLRRAAATEALKMVSKTIGKGNPSGKVSQKDVKKHLGDAVDIAAGVLHRALLLADFNIRRFIEIDESGKAYYNFKDATEEDWYCISEYSCDLVPQGKGDDRIYVDRIKLKAYDKLRALELVGKHASVGAFGPLGTRDNPHHTVMMSVEDYKQARQELLDKDDV